MMTECHGWRTSTSFRKSLLAEFQDLVVWPLLAKKNVTEALYLSSDFTLKYLVNETRNLKSLVPCRSHFWGSPTFLLSVRFLSAVWLVCCFCQRKCCHGPLDSFVLTAHLLSGRIPFNQNFRHLTARSNWKFFGNWCIPLEEVPFYCWSSLIGNLAFHLTSDLMKYPRK